MDEQEKELKDILYMLMEKIDNLETGQQALIDEVLMPVRKGMEERKFQNFKERYNDQLEPYAELTKLTEKSSDGSDFDLYRETYDGLKDMPEDKMDDGVDYIVDKLANKFDALRSELGIDPEADIEIKSDAEGQTEVEIKEDEASEAPSEVTETPSEVPAESSEVETKTEDVAEEAVPEEENEDELYEELRQAKKNIREV
jgi:hypothetical protein